MRFMTDAVDRIRIHELINLHGHLMDEGEFDRLDELFTDDVVYDVSALGGAQLTGRQAVVDAGRLLGERNPLGHHVTNVVVTEIDGDRARVRSKGLAVMSGGLAGSVVYDDDVRRTDQGWRIAIRRVLPRRVPLQRSDFEPREGSG
jgi:3-phenylpropionate/cinnamic acid dioxygenase small subunit